MDVRGEEVLYVIEGQGAAIMDCRPARMAPNTTLPESFARQTDVKAIEEATVFSKT